MQINLLIYFFLWYNSPMTNTKANMKNQDIAIARLTQKLERMEEIAVFRVSDLEFIEIVEVLKSGKWADWLVEFSYEGKKYQGSLQAGIEDTDFQHDIIEYVEEK